MSTYARCSGIFNIHLPTNLSRNLPLFFLNCLIFDKIMVMSLWPHFGPPCRPVSLYTRNSQIFRYFLPRRQHFGLFLYILSSLLYTKLIITNKIYKLFFIDNNRNQLFVCWRHCFLENVGKFCSFLIIICGTLCQFVRMTSFAKACFGEWFTRTSTTRMTRMNSCQCNLHHAISAVLDSYELTRVYSYESIRVSVRAP